MKNEKRESSPEQRGELFKALRACFGKNGNRYPGIERDEIQVKLEIGTEKPWSLNEMEKINGEPDAAGFNRSTGGYLSYNCAAENSKGHKSICYGHKGFESRKERGLENTMVDVATVMGTGLLMEEQYRELQRLGSLDIKMSG